MTTPFESRIYEAGQSPKIVMKKVAGSLNGLYHLINGGTRDLLEIWKPFHPVTDYQYC
jgi:hypothetical protein